MRPLHRCAPHARALILSQAAWASDVAVTWSIANESRPLLKVETGACRYPQPTAEVRYREIYCEGKGEKWNCLAGTSSGPPALPA